MLRRDVEDQGPQPLGCGLPRTDLHKIAQNGRRRRPLVQHVLVGSRCRRSSLSWALYKEKSKEDDSSLPKLSPD